MKTIALDRHVAWSDARSVPAHDARVGDVDENLGCQQRHQQRDLRPHHAVRHVPACPRCDHGERRDQLRRCRRLRGGDHQQVDQHRLRQHQAGINVTAGVAVTINAAATDVVTLRGLDLDGNGSGVIGINISTVGAVHVHNVRIRGFTSAGINLETSNYTELYVADSHITECGNSSNNGGIFIQQAGSGSANVFVNRVRLENNSNGILANGSGSTGVAVNVSVVDSMVSGSAFNGIQAITTAGHQAVTVFVDHCVVSGNFSSGINVDGAAASGSGSAVVRIGDSSINNNVTGVSASNLGVLQSFKNNRISANSSDGTPIPAFPGPGGTALQ